YSDSCCFFCPLPHLALPYIPCSILPPRQPPSTLFPYTTLFRSIIRACLVEVEVEGQTEREPLVSRRAEVAVADRGGAARQAAIEDRKSTRLNSSHVKNSYAVICLKNKNIKTNTKIAGCNS